MTCLSLRNRVASSLRATKYPRQILLVRRLSVASRILHRSHCRSLRMHHPKAIRCLSALQSRRKRRRRRKTRCSIRLQRCEVKHHGPSLFSALLVRFVLNTAFKFCFYSFQLIKSSGSESPGVHYRMAKRK